MIFLQDLALVMIAAAIVTVLFQRFKQPVVLGYILAGALLGPHMLPLSLISDKEVIQTFSELGVIFLLFSLGLEFNLRKLKEVGGSALTAATLEILFMGWFGFQIGRFFGWNTMDSVFLGAILSVSSTTIIIKALMELGKTKALFAKQIFGILIVEDLLSILIIALLSAFATTGSLALGEIGEMTVRLSAFLVVLLIGGLIVVPRLLDYVARFKNNEMLLVAVVGLCFGVSLLAMKFGYSVALGAFLIGSIIAEARQIAKIEALTHPVRDLFSAVFFVSIGLLIDPKIIVQYWLPVLVISLVVIVGKVFTCSLGTFITGYDRRTSMRVGMGVSQIGEFSFIMASLGLSLHVTSDFLYPIAVAVSAITTLTTPYLLKWSDSFVALFDHLAPTPILNALDGYTRWVGALQPTRAKNSAGKILRRIAWQVSVNLLLITAVFIAAVFLKPRVQQWLPNLGEESAKAVLWLGAMLCCLPMLLTVFFKLRAAAMLLSEMTVAQTASGKAALRAVVSSSISLGGSLALFLFLLMLSSAILPSWKAMLVLGSILLCVILWMRRYFSLVYTKAQIALKETFDRPREIVVIPEDHDHPAPVTKVLESGLNTVPIAEGSPGAHKLISELQLRTLTGASIIGIERGGENIINPTPDEELKPGDKLLLLGSPEQLKLAHTALAG